LGWTPVQELKNRPKVSVAIPCYNYVRFLPEAVESALDQPGVDVDVIVVDNASTDGSRELALELASRDSRIRVITHDKNMGHVFSFNEGVHSATGDYVVLLCADDLLAPGSLKRATALMEANGNVAFAYGFSRSFTDNAPRQQTAVLGWSVWPGEQWLSRRYRTGGNVISSPEVVMRRTVMDQLEYDSRLPHTNDMLVWLGAALLGDVGRVIGPCQGYFREHGDNLHLSDVDGMLRDLRERRTAFEMVAAARANRLTNPERLVEQARLALARESLKLACRSYDRGESLHGVAAEDYASFALETCPDVRRSVLWTAYELRANGQLPRVLQMGAEQINELRHKVRWRAWRWYGS
jgi:hypothetical protein